MRAFTLILAVLLGMLPALVSAAVKPAALFSDHAVLQRGRPLPVWGHADPGEPIVVQLAGQEVATRADAAGRWRVTLVAITAAGPHTMTIRGSGAAVKIDDILVGEVWVCSGQSNMERAMRLTQDAEKEIAAANFPQIRLLTVPKRPATTPRDDLDAKWELCSPATVAGFSAVAYYYGRELTRELGCPVGLIHSSWGGTVAKVWTPESAMKADPQLHLILEREQERIRDLPKARIQYEKNRAAWEQRRAADPKKAGPSPLEPTVASKGGAAHLYNGMIHPLIPYAMRGVAWYQGESNRNAPQQYRALLPALIQSWRAAWGQDDAQFGRDFPFLLVQIANYLAPNDDPNVASPWAEIREVQRLTSREVRHAPLSVTIDIGDEKDIHPLNKLDVGKRLALSALKLAYGREIVASGPSFQAIRVEEAKAVLTFGDVGGGLVAKGGELTGFAIAGEDRRYFKAQASIVGDTVIVAAPQVTRPVAVRYLWADNPTASLFNREGLPASPFQTDSWPAVWRKAEGAEP